MDRHIEVTTQNRGVNITSEDFEPEEDDVLQQNATGSKLQTDIQNMFEAIETATPHFLYTSSVDGDNEESLISSTSIVSSVVKVKQMGINKDASITMNSQSESSVCPCGEPYNVHPECYYDQPQPLCIPAVLPPAVLCMNPHCVCAHSKGVMQNFPVHLHGEAEKHFSGKTEKHGEKKCKLSTIFEKITGKEKHYDTAPIDMYKMNITQQRKDHSPPKRFVFDLVEGAHHTTGTNTKLSPRKLVAHETARKIPGKKCNCLHVERNNQYTGMVLNHQGPEEYIRIKRQWSKNIEDKLKYKNKKDNSRRVDVYYFDHGNAAYYRTTDSPPAIHTELVAEKAENYATKFWAEVFGTVYIGFAFVTSFILQLFRFVCHSILRPLTIGLLQLLSDYFLKPFLAVCFNSVIQPPLIFIYNIATSLRDLCDPIAEAIGYFLRETAVLCKSIRLFEIKRDDKGKGASNASCNCNEDKNCQKV